MRLCTNSTLPQTLAHPPPHHLLPPPHPMHPLHHLLATHLYPTTMNDHNDNLNVRLKIWQQNLNASLIAQLSLLNSPEATKWDIMVIQEPHINFLCNTSATHHWHVLYPSQHLTHPQQRTRVIILISMRLDTNSWKQITFPSSDVIAIQLSGPYGRCTLFNIYNDGTHHNMLTLFDKFLEHNIASIKAAESDHMLWLGDFNHHHPLWEDIWNCHLFNYTTANPLIDLIADHEMLQLLPCGIPTLQSSSTGNWTHPDEPLQ